MGLVVCAIAVTAYVLAAAVIKTGRRLELPGFAW